MTVQKSRKPDRFATSTSDSVRPIRAQGEFAMKTALQTCIFLVAVIFPTSHPSAKAQTQHPNEALKERSAERPATEDLMLPGNKDAAALPDELKLQMAKDSLKAVVQTEAEWNAAKQRVERAVRSQTQQLNLFTEAETFKAMEEYAIKVKASGVELMNAYAELMKKNIELKGNITRGPVFMREVAELFRRGAETERFADIKARYLKSYSFWMTKAKGLEKRGTKLDSFKDPELYAYLESWDRYLALHVRSLQSFVDLDKSNLEEVEDFKDKLTDHMGRLQDLNDLIDEWHKKAMEQAEDPTTREEVQKGKLSSLMTSHGIPFSRSSLGKGIVLSYESYRELKVGDTVLIVGFEPESQSIKYLARARLKERNPDRYLELMDKYHYSSAHLAILPTEELSPGIPIQEDLRKAHKISVEQHVAVIEWEKAKRKEEERRREAHAEYLAESKRQEIEEDRKEARVQAQFRAHDAPWAFLRNYRWVSY